MITSTRRGKYAFNCASLIDVSESELLSAYTNLLYVCESDYFVKVTTWTQRERESDWLRRLTARIRISLHPSVGEVKDRYLRRPSRRSNTNSRRVSNMIIHIEATGELVSSPRERETREMKERTAIVLQSNVEDPSLDDRHVVTRDKGQLSNRNLRDPSYLGNSSQTQLNIRCWRS